MMLRFTVCVVIAASALNAEKPKLSAEMQSVADLAQATPPEFNADALLRIAGSGKVAEAELREELIEQAFRLASAAQLKLPMRPVPGSQLDTRQGSLGQTYSLKLDALSLRTRAVSLMIGVNPKKARELFTQIPKLTLERLSCDDALVYDVGAYYNTLGAVVQKTFTEKERKKEEDINFLLDYVSQITSPLQLAPAAEVVQHMLLDKSQRDLIIAKLNSVLESMSADPRSYGATEEWLGRVLDADMAASHLKYVDKNSAVAQCQVITTAATADKSQPTSGLFKIDRYWQSATAQHMLAGGLALRAAGPNKGEEWLQKLTDYRKDMAGWSASDEPIEADYYHEKSQVYQALLELIPSGAERDKVLQEFVAFLSSANLQQQKPVEWFQEPRGLLQRTSSASDGDPSKVMDAYQSSGNPILVLFVVELKLFESKMPSWAVPPSSN